MSRFKALDLRVDTKPDLTPVTDADRGGRGVDPVDAARARPRDAVTGEEFGATGHGPRRWVLDPIDGTKNFVRGVPVWATLIALMDGDEVVAGLVSAPALGRRWWAAPGSGACTGQEPVVGQPDGGVRRDPARRRVAVLLQPLRLARPGPRGELPRPDPGRVAHPGVRRLLVLHAGGRGRGRRRRRAGGRAVRPGRARRSSSPRRAGGSPTSTAPTGRPAAARSRPTGTCTTRSCAASPPSELGRGVAR